MSSDANPTCRNNFKKCIIVLHIHYKHRLLKFSTNNIMRPIPNILTLLLLSVQISLLSAQTVDSVKHSNYVFEEPQIYPEYIGGGYAEASTFIQENLRYTDDMGCIEGTVYLEFIVDTLGQVKDVVIRRGISAAADAEAIRVIQLLSFIPGKSDGKFVETKMVWPVRFMYYEEDDE